MSRATIDDLPDEILEYIFYLLPPYKDVRCCTAVSRKWNEIAKSIIPRIKQSFCDSISVQNFTWETHHTKENITKRYAHSACRYRDSMYIFGGFTSHYSSFNDLWQLNLSTRAWSRISVEGKCPIPKACATIVTHGDKLILFGGMLPAMHRSLHQSRRLSNHIHVYHTGLKMWEEICPGGNWPVPELAGHSATIHNNKMIVFGGLGERKSVDDVYSFDLSTMVWKCVSVGNDKPAARFGHSQIFVDDQHLLILGGVTHESAVLDDAWLLDMSSESWTWNKIDVGAHAPLIRAVWCHSVCRVGKYVVVFKPAISDPRMYEDWLQVPLPRNEVRRVIPQEVNLNGKRGILSRISDKDLARDKNEPPRKAYSMKGQDLQSLNACESSSYPSTMREFKPLNSGLKASVELHVLDLSRLLDEGRLIHVRSKCRPLNYPSETILYSVVEGNGELIVFGGVQREINNYDDGTEEITPKISNTLQIIKLKTKIV